MSKILIVDDSITTLHQLRVLLSGKGYTVIEAQNGKDGIDILLKNLDCSLIISDVNMPIMDGITMCEKIHMIPEVNKIPIIMITTESTKELKAAGKAAGVTAWIVKPYQPESLLDFVTRLIPV